MGLHRDGSKLGLSPFESEMRRRLWWHLLSRDGRAAEDHGLQPSTSFNMLSGVNLPLNLNDNDLDPNMKELPAPRAGWTRMTLSLANIEVARAWARSSHQTWSTEGTPHEATRDQIVHQLQDRIESLLQHCNILIPEPRLAITIARFVLRKLDIVTGQQWQLLANPDNPKLLATDERLQEAVGVLEWSKNMWTDELLRPFRWSMQSYTQYHLIVFVLWYICVRPRGDGVKRAFESVEFHLQQARDSGQGPMQASKWSVLMALESKARTMLQRVHDNTSLGAEGVDIEPDSASTNVTGEMDWMSGHDPEELLDWNYLLHDFQLDNNDFSFTL